MTYKSVGKPVVITPENMERFAEAVSRPKPMVKPDHPIRRVDHPRKLGTPRDAQVDGYSNANVETSGMICEISEEEYASLNMEKYQELAKTAAEDPAAAVRQVLAVLYQNGIVDAEGRLAFFADPDDDRFLPPLPRGVIPDTEGTVDLTLRMGANDYSRLAIAAGNRAEDVREYAKRAIMSRVESDCAMPVVQVSGAEPPAQT